MLLLHDSISVYHIVTSLVWGSFHQGPSAYAASQDEVGLSSAPFLLGFGVPVLALRAAVDYLLVVRLLSDLREIVLSVTVRLVSSPKDVLIYVGVAVHVGTEALLELFQLLDLAASTILAILGPLPRHPVLFVVVVVSLEGRILLLLNGLDTLV